MIQRQLKMTLGHPEMTKRHRSMAQGQPKMTQRQPKMTLGHLEMTKRHP